MKTIFSDLEKFEAVMLSLRISGALAENCRLKGQSLPQMERDLIASIREAAAVEGISINLQTEVEQEGATLVRKLILHEYPFYPK